MDSVDELAKELDNSPIEKETPIREPENKEISEEIKNFNQKQEELMLESKKFFDFHKKSLGESLRKGNNVINLNFLELTEFSKDLAEEILSNPEESLGIIEQAIEEMGLAKGVRVRLQNLPKSQEVLIRNLRAKHLNEMIVIEGIIRQSSDVRPQVVNAKFECPSCGTILSVLQIEKKFREPTRCSCGRRGGFKVLSKEMVDTQRLVVEESPESLTGGQQPKRINVFVKEDLVEPRMEEKTTPGARIKVIGVLKEVPVPLTTGGLSTRFELAIEVNNLIPLEETFEELEISEEDERQILELSEDPDVFVKLAKSVAPSIWGYEEIKKSLVLQLFGGVGKEQENGSKTRGDIHILLMGDPGVAKSVILGYMANISPKGRYVVGKSASGTGLTATVVRDEYLKGWSLEAGAMVLANKGLVCIDELEKMDPIDRSAMHEAMEQQCMLPDFKLMLSNGKEIEIGKFIDRLIDKNKSSTYKGIDCEILPVNNVELLSTDFSKHFPLKANRVSRHLAPKEFVKIQLTDGKEITVTPEHPCWVVKEGKITTIPAEKLRKGEYFPIASQLDIKEEPYKKERDYLCKILGYHLSDGCYEINRGKKNGIHFKNNNETLIQDYKNSIIKYFKINPGITKRGNQQAVRVISEKVVDYFNKLDKKLLEKGNSKKIPEEVLSFSKENIKYLLRSLFDGNGTVVNRARKGCRIVFVTQNKILAKQVSNLLLRFGILSSIFQDKEVYRLDISGQDNLSKFLSNISFLSQHKKQKLKQYCEKLKIYRTIKNIIPNCTNKISQIFKELKISARKEIGHSIDLKVEKQRKFLQKLVLIAEKHAIQQKNKKILSEILKIKKLAFGYARWMKIKEVKKIKNKNIKWVYDVTTEPTRTFISNGMVLHNTVTISKASVQATLKAATSVLAAANPKFGVFDPYQSIPQQIDLPPTLINRFDIIFTLRDLPSKERDEKIASHILEQQQNTEIQSTIPVELFRKYVAYAKQRVRPRLSNTAVKKLKDFYIKLRNSPIKSESATRAIPISARQLGALVRMAEASAKIKLSPEVTEQDAKQAIELMQFYLMQVGYDYETKTFDINKIATGITSSKRNKIFSIREIITALEEKLGKLIPLEEVEKEVEGKVSKDELDEIIQKLKESGEIFSPRRGYIQKV